MAKGSSHALASMLAAMCGSLQVPTNIDGFAWSLGAIIGTVLTPDLDQIDFTAERTGGYYGQYVLRETFPPVVERLWYIYFQPYARLFKHRSFWTHFPIVGTAGRLLYAFWWLFPFYWWLPESKIYFILALAVSDILHAIMDWRLWTKLGFFKQGQ